MVGQSSENPQRTPEQLSPRIIPRWIRTKRFLKEMQKRWGSNLTDRSVGASELSVLQMMDTRWPLLAMESRRIASLSWIGTMVTTSSLTLSTSPAPRRRFSMKHCVFRGWLRFRNICIHSRSLIFNSITEHGYSFMETGHWLLECESFTRTHQSNFKSKHNSVDSMKPTLAKSLISIWLLSSTGSRRIFPSFSRNASSRSSLSASRRRWPDFLPVSSVLLPAGISVVRASTAATAAAASAAADWFSAAALTCSFWNYPKPKRK